MSKEEMKAKLDELDKKMSELGENAVDTVKLHGMYAKEEFDEKAKKHKGNINALKENIRILAEKAKGKASSELLKAQMNIDVAKEKVQAKKEAYDKAQMEDYICDVIDYAEVCVALSILAAEEAQLATLEAIEASAEYDEKYGKSEE